jgi:GntR family transcriptional repressor for pyruvate dehydrogenase complex
MSDPIPSRQLHDVGSPSGTAEGFSRLTPRTVTGDAVEQIKRMISSGTLAPGQKLPAERVLADRLGVSRPTMREVMRALEAMGVVVPRHGSGTYVTDLTGGLLARPLVFVLDVNRRALGDIFSVRVMLETGAAEAAARRMTAEQLGQLELHVAEMRGATDADTLLVPDLEFHRLVHEASGNEVLLALMDGLRTLTRESLLASAGLPDARQLAVAEHAAIVAALRERDPVAAAAAMRRHVEGAHQRAAAARPASADDVGVGQVGGGSV